MNAYTNQFETVAVAEEAGEATHEAFIHAVRRVAVARVNDEATRERLLSAKLVYGGGPQGVRGVTYYGAWQNSATHDFLEVAACGEESHVQLAGTTIHELAHSLAGRGTGHGPEWKAACRVLGLAVAQAAGQSYAPAHFAATVWASVEALPLPADGRPAFGLVAGAGLPRRLRPCSLGVGTRGGTSRGTGSGSRLRLWVCGCPEGTSGRKVRVASDDFDATCNRCGQAFARQP